MKFFRFASPVRPGCVDYKRFAEVIEEAFTQACLERAPLIIPVQHVPTRDCERNFLNFDERRTLSIGIQKLSKKPELQMNLMSIFEVTSRPRVYPTQSIALLRMTSFLTTESLPFRFVFVILFHDLRFRFVL